MKKMHASCIFLFMLLASWMTTGNGMNTTIKTGSPQESSISTKEWPTAWVIIAGDRADHKASWITRKTCEFVYDSLLACGYTDNTIYYLISDYEKDNTTREDGVTSKTSIHDAIHNWGSSRVSADGVLGIYMLDHGGPDFMCIYPDEDLTAHYFDMILDGFQSQSGCDRIYIIYEACYSGSFIDDISQPNRIIMTSTDVEHDSGWSPYPPHLSLFAETFFTSVRAKKSMGEAFCDVRANIVAIGSGEDQYPCIDDNHDDVGHIVNAWGSLPSTGDGNDALNVYLCTNCLSCPSADQLRPPKIQQVPLKGWTAHCNPLTIPVRVSVWNSTPVASVICRVVSANWTPPPPIDNESISDYDPRETIGNFHWPLAHDGDGNYSGIIEVMNPDNNSDYRLNFIAEDIDGVKSLIETTWLGVNGDGTPPSDTMNPELYITSPTSDANIKDTVNITVKGYDDQELDEIKIYFDGTLVNTTTMPDHLPYPNAVFACNTTAYSNGVHNITAMAKDKTGNTNTTSILVTINNPSIPGFQVVHVAIGCILAVITIHALKFRRNERAMK